MGSSQSRRPCAVCFRKIHWAGACVASSRSMPAPPIPIRLRSRRRWPSRRVLAYDQTQEHKKTMANSTIHGRAYGTVNGREVAEYFPRKTSVMILRQPLELVEKAESLDVQVNVCGGGESGQAGAVRHGIARALLVVDPELRSALKRAGFLTRDARKKERKKPGQPGARKKFQYSKR